MQARQAVVLTLGAQGSAHSKRTCCGNASCWQPAGPMSCCPRRLTCQAMFSLHA